MKNEQRMLSVEVVYFNIQNSKLNIPSLEMLNNEQRMLNVEVVYFNIQNSKLNILSLEMLNNELRMLNVEVFIKNKTPDTRALVRTDRRFVS